MTKTSYDIPNFLEKLEDRIAPAALNESGFHAVAAGSSILLNAGEGLGSANGAGAGTYYIYVEKGSAMVFTTDLNADGIVDANEITGISAGDGLSLISFVDINGDIVTNLKSDGTLTDSDGDASNGLDGAIVLNNHIDSITLRSVTAGDLNAAIDHNTVNNRIAISTYSINGSIFAGGGIGSTAKVGLLIDTTGFDAQEKKFTDRYGIGEVAPTPSVGYIYAGSEVGGHNFSFGTSPLFGNGPAQSLRGVLAEFIPAAGQAGADIIGVKAIQSSTVENVDGIVTETLVAADFHLSGLYAGDGGFGARGGNIQNVLIQGDIGNLFIVAGDGGDGVNGGNGGGITNLSLTGSSNSQILLQTGDGGYGLIGTAGAAGALTLNGVVEIYGNVTVGLGKGGDALGTAGAGTSLSSGKFTLTDIGALTPSLVVSTYREAGDLDRPRAFDFDGDGFSDAIYLSTNPQQLVVLFGTASGGFNLNKTQFLDAGTYADALTRSSAVEVGDFNGDGNLDIVTASSTGTGYAGLKTFLGDGQGGFSDALYSSLYTGGSVAITQLSVGDFNRDGITDVAVVFNSEYKAKYSADVVIMSGLTNGNGVADGYFAADFKKGTTSSRHAMPVFDLSGDNGSAVEFDYIMKATGTQKGDVLSDVLVLGYSDPDKPIIVLQEKPAALTGNPTLTKVGSSSATFQARTFSEGITTYGEKVGISIVDFSIIDVGGDGVFDVVVVGTAGDNVLAILQGTATGGLSQPDSKGIQLTSTDPNIHSVLGAVTLSLNGSIKSSYTVAGSDNELSISAVVTANDKDSNKIYPLIVNGFMTSDATVVNATSVNGFSPASGTLGGPAIFDAYYLHPDDAALKTAFIGARKANDTELKLWSIISQNGSSTAIAGDSLSLTAGEGGSSLLGQAGAGGSIGAGSLSSATGTVTGSIDISGFYGAIVTAGNGGDGFTGGGKGGNISGFVNLGYNLSHTTGNGGNALMGRGGDGGSFSQFNLTGIYSTNIGTSLEMFTGYGGFGLQGGAGGSITGSSSVYDASFGSFLLVTGDGGNGISLGGAGGNISNFLARFAVLSSSGSYYSTGTVIYGAGSGGDAVVGTGGKGGSVTSFSPDTRVNSAYGFVYISSGYGGDGYVGGAGGSVIGFINRPTTESNPYSLDVFAGIGGDGVTTGGAGGSIQNISMAASSSGGITSFLAGNGGIGSGGVGGAGGILSNITTTAQAGAVVAITGNGGDGLTVGGVGGTATSLSLDAGALEAARVVAMAGKGGDAFGVTLAQIIKEGTALPAFQSLVAWGTVNGRGGNGGSINTFTQPVHVLTSTDLVAGNGGSSINYGNDSTTTGVGKGGSITNVKLAGDSGIIDANVAIRNYQSDFADDIRDGTISVMDVDTAGNVGVLVGVNGSVRGGMPVAVTGGVGSVTNFAANNIMSMVAGSVDNIARITTITGLKLNGGSGILGAEKNIDAEGTIILPGQRVDGNAYWSKAYYEGVIIGDAQAGGSLIDGAIMANTYNGPTSSQARVF